jgi:hypothetical protein
MSALLTGAVILQHVYSAMVVPQMPYGCSAWHIPGNSYTSRGYAITSTIRRIQRRVAQIITGVPESQAERTVANRLGIIINGFMASTEK